MKFEGAPRQDGKTTRLIKQASKVRGGYIVCCSHCEARRVAEVAEAMGLAIPFPLTFDEFINWPNGSGVKALFIDQVDLILARFGRGIPIRTVTYTEPEEFDDH